MTVFAERMYEVLVEEPEHTAIAVSEVRGRLPLQMRAAERRWLEMYEGAEASRESDLVARSDEGWAKGRWP